MSDSVRADIEALTSFARLGLRMFWFRQVMFIGATVITTAYLASWVPVLSYLACLSAELGEISLGRRILATKDLDAQKTRRFIRLEALVSGWSAAAVSAYGVTVAAMGDEAFLFVPLTYVFAAALYGTIFNHQIKPVLIARMALYVTGFLAIGGMGLLTAPPDQQFLAFAIFFTTLSAAFFFVINAIVFRQNFTERQAREISLHREIAERKAAERALERSETRFKSLFESAPIPIREEDLSGMKRLVDALNLPDPDDFAAYLDAHPEFLEAAAQQITVLDANRVALEQHGYTEKPEMLAKVVRALSPAAKQIVRRTVTALHQGAPGDSYETRITRADGQQRTVAATWSVLPGHEDNYARILLCSVDLTERLAIEEALRQAQKMEAVGQLTGGVAHDFNNLLTVIRGNMELLAEAQPLDPELATPITKAVTRGAELTQRLLAFSRKQPLAASSIDLAELLEGLRGLLSRSLGEEHPVAIDLTKTPWPAHADPGQVETALLNLALNARDAMPGGGTLTISCQNQTVRPDTPQPQGTDLAPGDYVVLAVTDTGTGMTPEVIARAIEPFFTTKEVGKGSGLGLSMVYGFAKQSGGALAIDSRLGQGTTVSLYLPRSDADSPPASGPGTTPLPAAAGQGETILLLEDDQGVRSYLTRLMKNLGYTALAARDAQAAREILDESLKAGRKIDLLISDIMLPGGVRGPDFAAEMRARTPETPVIFVSGYPAQTPPDLSGADALDRAEILAKPFRQEDISQKIQEALSP